MRNGLVQGALLCGLIPLTAAVCGESSAFGSASADAAAVIAACGLVRATEFRPSGGFSWAPCAVEGGSLLPAVRCEPQSPRPLDCRPGSLARLAEARAVASPSPAALHAAALWRLASPKGLALKAALPKLERAASSSPDPSIWNDLGVARAELARQRNDPLLFLDAYEAFAKAASRRPFQAPPPEALFNLALAAERLGLERDARAAWLRVAARERDPDWQREIQSHLNRGTEILPAGNADPAARREKGLFQLLPEWGKSFGAGDLPAAAPWLAAARRELEGLAAHPGERSLAETVAAVDEALRRQDIPRLRALAAGLADLGAGKAAYDRSEYAAAIPRLDNAGKALERAACPAALWASYYAVCARHGNGKAVQASLARLERGSAGHPYAGLAALIAWMRGRSLFNAGHLPEALRSYQAAADGFRAVGESENAATVESLVGLTWDSLGEPERAWQHLLGALATHPTFTNSRRRNLFYTNLTDVAWRRGKIHLALGWQHAALAGLENSQFQAEGLLWLAFLRERLGEGSPVLASLEAARQALAGVSDLAARERTATDLDMVEGRLLVATSPRDALGPLDRSVEYYSRRGLQVFAASLALEARAQAALKLKDLAGAAGDLERALAIVDQRIAEDAELRPWEKSLLRRDRDTALFDAMIAFQLGERHDPAAALDYVERAKVSDGRWGKPLPAGEVADALPARTAVIQMWVGADAVWFWRLERGAGPRVFRAPLPAEAVGLGARAFLRREIAAWRQSGFAVAAGRRLSGWLVQPWAAAVAAGDRLAVIPDPALEDIPWGALVDPGTGRFVVEDHAVVVAPCASAFVRLQGIPAPLPDEGRVVAVGDPQFDPQAFPLAPLPGAEAEARWVSALSPRSVLLLGREATWRRFAAAAPLATAIHFAGHARLIDEDPEGSLLLFARDQESGTAGAASIPDVLRLDLPRHPLVVLSACGSGRRGRQSLATAFLKRGARAVVATLADVPDASEAAGQLLQGFYRSVEAGVEPSVALQEVQKRWLASSSAARNGPKSWAVLQIYGRRLERSGRLRCRLPCGSTSSTCAPWFPKSLRPGASPRSGS